jgi:hypothetical protein
MVKDNESFFESNKEDLRLQFPGNYHFGRLNLSGYSL